jgi:CO dehydrogenase maturation factor
MKLAVTGKGGVGKTTIAALLAQACRGHGNRVIAIDADPDANLAPTLGYPHPERIVPLCSRKDLIEERVGSGGMIRLNPRVDDLVDRLGVDVDGIRLMVLGTIPRGGSGCFCSPSALLKAFLAHALTLPEEWVILDMEAGLEHLGRGSSRNVDSLLIVVEPSLRSLETAERIRLLAADLGIRNVHAVANKITGPEELDLIQREIGPVPLAGAIPCSAGLGGFSARVAVDNVEPSVREALEGIYTTISTSQGAHHGHDLSTAGA